MSAASVAETEPRDPSQRCSVAVVVLGYAALATALSAILNVWLDEAYTLDSTGRGPAWALERALGFEMQPPLYFVALSLWRVLGDSIFIARLPSVLMATAALGVAAHAWRVLTRDGAPSVNGAWIVLPLALHPLVLYAGTEARVYASILLAGALAALTYARGFLDGTGSRWARLAFTAVAVAALYSHYYSGFLLAAGLVPLLVRRDLGAVRAYVLWMAAAGLVFVPLALQLPQQVSGHVHTVREPLGALDLARFAYVRGASFLLPAVREQEGLLLRRLRDVVLLAGGAVVVLALLRTRARSLAPPMRALVIWCVSALLAFTVVVALVGSRDQVASRHMMIALVPTMLAAFGTLRAVGGRRGVIAGSVVVALFAGVASLRTYESGAKRGDWKRVAAYLEAREEPDEPILVFHAPSALALRHHYHGVNAVLPIPDEPSETRWHLPDYRLESGEQIARRLEAVAPGHESLWLITDGIDRFMGVDLNAGAIDSFIADGGYRVFEQRPFHMSYVQHLRRAPHARR